MAFHFWTTWLDRSVPAPTSMSHLISVWPALMGIMLSVHHKSRSRCLSPFKGPSEYLIFCFPNDPVQIAWAVSAPAEIISHVSWATAQGRSPIVFQSNSVLMVKESFHCRLSTQPGACNPANVRSGLLGSKLTKIRSFVVMRFISKRPLS